MAKIGRNSPCPCGSGRKYKKCCALKRTPVEQSDDSSIKHKGLKPAIRMKGGIGYDPVAHGYVAIVHSWDNEECRGEPEEWRDPKVFTSEDEAMHYYKSTIRPSLEKLMNQFKKSRHGISGFHRKLED